ncbi:hypothetical protein D3C81_1824620 [compost metagenome]
MFALDLCIHVRQAFLGGKRLRLDLAREVVLPTVNMALEVQSHAEIGFVGFESDHSVILWSP